ncbi:MAG TPA: diacylglycerol kinase family protein [Solirubrobacteraceae bacterium]|nr:diacylglycerol kinase family protein [Solirubrobacteraceae bacterium]
MTPTLETLERLAAASEAGPAAPSKRMLIVVNPYATTVSDRLRNLVVYALRGRYEVDAVDTERQGHATELCREAALEGYDVVVAFGGDGTVNEAANGLAGSGVPLTCLPGGATNVYCRALGIPVEIVDATEHLLRMVDDWRPRRVDLARAGERCFTFSSGIGLDASVVERVDAHPYRKARFGEWYFTSSAVATFVSRYLVSPPQLVVSVDGQELTGVTAIVQNDTPYTYFNRRPIELGEDVDLESGTLSTVVLRRASPLDMPTVIWRAFSRRARMVRHRQVDGFTSAAPIVVRSADGRPLPLQVDGDYVGEVDSVEYAVIPQALSVVS